MEYGENIKAARKAAGLTQAELAQRCGLATVTVRQYESGKREPRKDQMQAIANALGVKVWELMGFDGFIRIPIPEYPLSMPTKEQFDKLPPSEQEYVVLRILADTAPDSLKNRYMENYEKLNKLGKVEAVRRTAELTRLHEYTDHDRRQDVPESPVATSGDEDTPPPGETPGTPTGNFVPQGGSN